MEDASGVGETESRERGVKDYVEVSMPSTPRSQPDHKSKRHVDPSQAGGTVHNDKDIRKQCLVLKSVDIGVIHGWSWFHNWLAVCPWEI